MDAGTTFAVNEMDRYEAQPNIHKWLFIFGLCFAVWHIIPVFLGWEIKGKFTIGDLVDLSTPFVLLGLVLKLYFILQRQRRETEGWERVSIFGQLLLIFGAIVFVQGHGIHLASNAIYRYLVGNPTSPLSSLTYFFDEIQSHFFWDSGLLLIAFGLILLDYCSDSRSEPISAPSKRWIFCGALLYGFTHFCNGVEGQTAVLTFPAAVLIPVLLVLISWVMHLRLLLSPVILFYFTAFLTADILFIFWGILHKGFPQFSELGWF